MAWAGLASLMPSSLSLGPEQKTFLNIWMRKSNDLLSSQFVSYLPWRAENQSAIVPSIMRHVFAGDLATVLVLPRAYDCN